VSRITRLTMAATGAVAAIAASVFVRLLVRRRADPLGGRVRVALQAVHDDFESIDVRAERGIVTLRGEVDDIRDIGRLEAVARAVPGVRDVDNLLRLQLTASAIGPRVLSA
jgi:hypothetical protein